MATARVKRAFTCKLGGGVFLVGDSYEGTAERIAELAEGGFVEKPARKPARKKTAETKEQ